MEGFVTYRNPVKMLHNIQPDIRSYQNVTQKKPFSSGNPSPVPSAHYFLVHIDVAKTSGQQQRLRRWDVSPIHLPVYRFSPLSASTTLSHCHILSFFFCAFLFSSVTVSLSFQLSSRQGDAGFQRHQLHLWVRTFYQPVLTLFCYPALSLLSSISLLGDLILIFISTWSFDLLITFLSISYDFRCSKYSGILIQPSKDDEWRWLFNKRGGFSGDLIEVRASLKAAEQLFLCSRRSRGCRLTR